MSVGIISLEYIYILTIFDIKAIKLCHINYL
jgi:hypothetical protein